MSESPALDWRAVMALARAAASRLPEESVALDRGLWRVLAAPVAALQDIPHFASSAMDGWAVSGSGPWTLTDPPLAPGTACAIVTGAVMPHGAVGVLRSEWGRVADGTLIRSDDARPGEPGEGTHVRQPGTEASRLDTLIEPGTMINPAHIALAAVAGHDTMVVTRRPRVTLLLTGDEVDVGGVPAAGRVRDAFGPQLPAVLGMLGADVVATTRVPDLLPPTIAALQHAAAASDLIVTTGGTGRSDADHIRDALDQLSATVLVPGVPVRPGGPTLLARLPTGALLAGLPGNPLAAMIGVLLVVRPAIEGLLDLTADESDSVVAAADLPAGRAVTLVPYRMTSAGAVAVDRVGSGMMRGLAGADGVLVVPAEGVRQGERVERLPLPWSYGRAT